MGQNFDDENLDVLVISQGGRGSGALPSMGGFVIRGADTPLHSHDL